MNVVYELQALLAEVREKTTGDLADAAEKVQEAFHKLLDDDGVADDVTEKVAEVLKEAAERLSAVANKTSGLFEAERVA